MNYNLVAGTDQQTLDRLIGEFYRTLYPALFKGSLEGDQVVYSSVEFDVSAPPKVNLAISEGSREAIREEIDESEEPWITALSAAERSRLVEAVTASSFELTVPSFVLTLHPAGEGGKATRVTASLLLSVAIRTDTRDGANRLTIKAIHGEIGIADDEILATSLNSLLIPPLLAYFNDTLLTPLEIPLLKFGATQVSLPLPVVQPPHIAVYSALGANQPEAPPPHPWPADCVFVGMDAALLRAAASTIFPIGPSAGFHWGIVSGEVRAQILTPDPITINGDGSLSGTFSVNASAQLTAHPPWPFPEIAFGPSATASLSVGLKPSLENGHLVIVPTEIPMPDFDFSMGTLSDIAKIILFPLFAGLQLALNAVLGPLIVEALKGVRITVLQVPPLTADLGGKHLTLSLEQAGTSAGGPDGSLLLVSVRAKIS